MWLYGLIIAFALASAARGYQVSRYGIRTWYNRLTIPAEVPNVNILTWLWIAAYLIFTTAIILLVHAGPMSINDIIGYFWVTIAGYFLVGILGLIWIRVFFNFHRIMPAIYLSALMCFLIFCSAVLLMQVSVIAAVFSIIYLVWLIYIARISYLVWELNP